MIVPFPDLLQQMLDHCTAESKSHLKAKAHRLYVMCLRRGKDEIAGRIKAKYGPWQYDDRTTAFGFALMHRK